MPRGKSHSRPRRLQVRVQAVAIPKRTKPAAYLKKLITCLDTLEPLPEGWDVRLHWRNPGTMVGATAHWQEADFSDAIQDSADGWGPGFGVVLRDMLVRKLGDVRERRRK